MYAQESLVNITQNLVAEFPQYFSSDEDREYVTSGVGSFDLFFCGLDTTTNKYWCGPCQKVDGCVRETHRKIKFCIPKKTKISDVQNSVLTNSNEEIHLTFPSLLSYTTSTVSSDGEYMFIGDSSEIVSFFSSI